MNRIYQGRVKTVELLKEKTKKGENPVIRECTKAEGEQLLWEFHELFQDAVNYYLVCLMALASDPENPITKIRCRVDSNDPEYNVWKTFRRKGQYREGMCRVAKYLGLDPQEATLDACCKKALEGNDSRKDLLDLALQELLHYCSGDSNIQKEGRSMLPRFCKSDYLGNYNTGSTANLREYGEGRLSYDLHLIKTESELNTFADELEIGWVVNVSKRGKIATGEESRNRLLKAVAHFGQAYGISSSSTKMGERVKDFLIANPKYEEKLRSLEQHIKSLPTDDFPEILPNEKSIPDRLEAFLLLHHFPSSDLAELLKVSFPFKEKSEQEANPFEFKSEDAIKSARGTRGYVFPAFTARDFFKAKNVKPEWIEFDIAAFKEALKALHQIEQKGEERKKERDRNQMILGCMKGDSKTRTKLLSDESIELPPVIEDDPRIDRLEKVLESLAQVSDLAEEELSEYGLSERTIRGFELLVEKWNQAKVENLSEIDARAKLKQKLNELQVELKNTMGSVALFEKLMERENWIVWQKSGDWMPDDYEEKGFARNPLDAYVQKLKLEEDIKRLEEPIRFTPADARYSRRQYQFGDKNTFSSLKGQYHHEQNQLAVVVGMAIRENGIWEKRRVRLNYSAPRFLRDGLRADSESLSKMPWLQPMMEALGEDMAFPQDLHNFPVFLMPKRGRNDEIIVNLNFPVTLEESALVDALGKRERWTNQFAGGRDSNIYLLWPKDEWPKGWKENAWYNRVEPFRFVSVDLGVRDSGALALIESHPDQEFYTSKGTKRHCRFIGEANGQKWYASVIKTKMLRLPGEDEMVWRDGIMQQELSGEKGRLATKHETDQAQEIAASLGYADFIGDDIRFFEDQNHKLLVTLRWAQGRLRSWQSLSWKLDVDAEKAGARNALREQEKLSAALKQLAEKDKWTLVPEQLERDIADLKELLSVNLEKIANRVVPLRGRNWEWRMRDDGAGYILRQTERGSDKTKTRIAGQRGLSIERIEMIEELRRRCQSLNKALQHEPGTKPKLGFGTKGSEAPDPCPDILEKLDQLREQRVNQTAHLILAEALGVRLKPHSKSKDERISKDIHGEYEKVRDPVHFIVLEDLNRYLTSQGRSKAENSRLMKWCHRAILGKLKQLCETYGIPVLEVAAAYSSRFSAKDGVAGFRAKEVTVSDREKFPWKKLIEDKDPDAVRLFRQLDEISIGQNPEKPRKLLAPIAGGPIFIPMVGSEIQADINAAINLGLRAVAAPEVLEIHHRIRTESDGNGSLKPLTRSKRETARWDKNPESFQFEGTPKLERSSNCFPLVGFRADFENCTLNEQCFATGKGLWSTIKQRQWIRVQQLNEQRIRKNGWGEIDDIPYDF